MARISVRFFATIREVVGISSETYDAESIASLIDMISRAHGVAILPADADIIHLSDTIVILVNGHNIHQLKGLDTPLSDGDEVAFFPPISGG